MYFVNVRYKIYDWSTRATILNILGAILKAFCWICMCSIIIMLIMIPTAANPNYKEDLKFVIPVVLIAGIILSIIGRTLQKKAEKMSELDFVNKVKNDFYFAKKMAKKNPKNKEWYINQNSEYSKYVSSGNEELDQEDEYSDVKKISLGRRVLGVILAIVFVFGGMYLLGAFKLK